MAPLTKRIYNTNLLDKKHTCKLYAPTTLISSNFSMVLLFTMKAWTPLYDFCLFFLCFANHNMLVKDALSFFLPSSLGWEFLQLSVQLLQRWFESLWWKRISIFLFFYFLGGGLQKVREKSCFEFAMKPTFDSWFHGFRFSKVQNSL